MKLITFCLLIFFTIHSPSAISQNIDVWYELKMKTDTTNLNYTEEGLFVLSIRDNQSIFYSNSFGNLLNPQRDNKKEEIDPTEISSFYIISYKNGKTNHYQPIDGEFYQYEDLESISWNLEDEHKTIDSLTTNKATTSFRGRNWTVWYSLDIPVPEGPYKFKGLPGLVINASSDDGDYFFSLNGIEKNKEELNLPPAAKLTNREVFLKQIKKYAENPSYSMAQEYMNNDFDYDVFIDGKKVNKSEEAKRYNEFVWMFMRNHNNPIEKDDIWIR